MKSERRHELQQNELADQLDKARTWIEPYAVPILLVVIAVTVIGMGYNFMTTRAVSDRSEATFDLLLSSNTLPGAEADAEAYNQVVTKFPESPQANIASLAKGDIFLSRAINAMFRDRDEANSLLGDAEKAYQAAMEGSTSNLIRSRAQFGLAQTAEAKPDLAAAKEAYEKVIAYNESEAMVELAKRRIADLENADVKEFAEWFAKQEPTNFQPAEIPGMPSGVNLPDQPTINLPDFGLPNAPAEGSEEEPAKSIGDAIGGQPSNQPLPENPDIAVPDPNAPAAPAEEAASGAEVPPAEPAAGEEPMTEAATPADPPATEEPAAEEPAAEEPATEEPATEKPAPAEEPVTEEPAPAEEPAGTDGGEAGDESPAETPADDSGDGSLESR